jgi:hypothetical protein
MPWEACAMQHHSRRLSEIAVQYVRSRKGSSPVSTADGVRAIRFLATECSLSSRELADMIAKAAIKQGRQVAFDSEAEPVPALWPVRSIPT